MNRHLNVLIAAVGASLCTLVAAQPTKPPQLVPDQMLATQQRALAQVMTVPPTVKRRDQGQVLRETGLASRTCTVNVAPLPDKHERAGGLGNVNQVVVVNASPVIACGR